MISAFVGLPRAGKTYEAVKKIWDNLRMTDSEGNPSPRRVYTNIAGMDDPVHRACLQHACGLDDYLFNKFFVWVPDSEMVHFWDFVKDGSLIIIDEVHKLFNNRDWNADKNRRFADWCSTHGHHHFDVILVTQDMEKVEKQVRSLIEWTWVYQRINFLGKGVRNRYMVYGYSGDETKGKPLTPPAQRGYNHIIFTFYASTSNNIANKQGLMDHVNILRQPIFFAIPVVVGIFLYLLFGKSSFAHGDLFGSKKFLAKRAVVVSKSALPLRPSPSVPVQRPVSSARAFAAHSSSRVAPVTVAGFVQDGGVYHVLYSDGSTGVSRTRPHY